MELCHDGFTVMAVKNASPSAIWDVEFTRFDPEER
jgi:hypothetical protein